MIGVGFILMRLGSAVARPDWLTMLPGCVIAGIGLGTANTRVACTTRGCVCRDRGGIASGMEVSARMISLAVNIAVMGFILTNGALMRLRAALTISDAGQLNRLAEDIATGNGDLISAGVSEAVAREALQAGFGWVTLYGAIGVWIMAGISFCIFNVRSHGRGVAAAPGRDS